MTLMIQLQQGLTQLQLELSDKQQERLLAFIKLLVNWSSTINLTAIRSEQEILIKHIFDSLSVVHHLSHSCRILDVGTGAGLPGLILAIALPHQAVTLLDSQYKKISFLHQAVYTLALENVTIVHQRIQNYTSPHKFDAVISRAVTDSHDFVAITHHVVADDGELFLMKGQYPEKELQKLPEPFIIKTIHQLSVPLLAAKRHLVCIGKIT